MKHMQMKDEPVIFLDEDLPPEYFSGLDEFLQGKKYRRTLEGFMTIETEYYERYIKSRHTNTGAAAA